MGFIYGARLLISFPAEFDKEEAEKIIDKLEPSNKIKGVKEGRLVFIIGKDTCFRFRTKKLKSMGIILEANPDDNIKFDNIVNNEPSTKELLRQYKEENDEIKERCQKIEEELQNLTKLFNDKVQELERLCRITRLTNMLLNPHSTNIPENGVTVIFKD